jgi:hypothetical protein
MSRRARSWIAAFGAAAIGGAILSVMPMSAAAAAPTDYSGALPNGTTWKGVVPHEWNGTLLLYSHGYRPSFAGIINTPSIAPNEQTEQLLLDQGYALVGSSYASTGWALPTAPEDQLDSLDAFLEESHAQPEHILAYGTSMGGLVTGRLAETAGTPLEGAMPTCGLMHGGVDLDNYQLDGAHAIDVLLAPGQAIKLQGYDDVGEAFGATGALTAAVNDGQSTREGRARVALAAALFEMPDWLPGGTEPDAQDAEARQETMYEWLVTTIGFVTPGRYDIESAAGGNATWNVGVDYRTMFQQSEDRRTVAELYKRAGLDLEADLDLLTETADITPDTGSVESLNSTSSLTGDLQMPVLSMHTTDDNLAPVQVEEEYREDVHGMGGAALLRQTFVARPGHCAFTAAEIGAGIAVLEDRVVSGHWGGASRSVPALNRLASSFDAGGSDFVNLPPQEFLGDRTWSD